MELRATIADYRDMMHKGLGEVHRLAAEGRGNADEVQSAFRDYRRIFGILDAMTPSERDSPLDNIDSGRMRRISTGAGVTDRDVLRFLMNYNQYCELIARANFHAKHGGAPPPTHE